MCRLLDAKDVPAHKAAACLLALQRKRELLSRALAGGHHALVSGLVARRGRRRQREDDIERAERCTLAARRSARAHERLEGQRDGPADQAAVADRQVEQLLVSARLGHEQIGEHDGIEARHACQRRR